MQQEVLQASQEQDSELICAFCGNRGHRQRDCYNRDKAIRESNLLSTDQTARCTGCDSIGHSIAVCKVIRRNTPINNNDNRNREPRNNDNRDNWNRNNDQRPARSQNNRRNQNDYHDNSNPTSYQQNPLPNIPNVQSLFETLMSNLQTQNTHPQQDRTPNYNQNQNQTGNRTRYQPQNQNWYNQQNSYQNNQPRDARDSSYLYRPGSNWNQYNSYTGQPSLTQNNRNNSNFQNPQPQNNFQNNQPQNSYQNRNQNNQAQNGFQPRNPNNYQNNLNNQNNRNNQNNQGYNANTSTTNYRRDNQQSFQQPDQNRQRNFSQTIRDTSTPITNRQNETQQPESRSVRTMYYENEFEPQFDSTHASENYQG